MKRHYIELETKIFEDYPDVVDPKQLQEMLGISRSTAYSILQSGKIKARKIGRNYKITKVNIIKFLEQ